MKYLIDMGRIRHIRLRKKSRNSVTREIESRGVEKLGDSGKSGDEELGNSATREVGSRGVEKLGNSESRELKSRETRLPEKPRVEESGNSATREAGS